MSPDTVQPMPQHVRRYRAETDASWLDRLLNAHHIPESARPFYLTELRRRLPTGTSLVDALRDRPTPPITAFEAHLQACDPCSGTVGQRWVCTRCAGGRAVPQDPHPGPWVCRRHRRWVAPGVPPSQQRTVSYRMIRSDRRWQQLLQQGRANISGGAELQHLLLEWAAVNRVALSDEDRFVLMVRFWDQLTHPTTLQELIRPDDGYRLRHGRLAALVTATLPDGQHAALIDGVWAMLRPTALLHRTDLPDCDVPLDEPFHVLLAAAPHRVTVGPFPPVQQYYEPATTSRVSRWQDVSQKHIVLRRSAGIRWTISRGTERKVVIICPAGHRLVRPANNDYKSHLNAKFPCSYCSGRKPLAGYRSLADSGRRLAVTWHPTRNGTLTPAQVTTNAKRIVWWRCPRGHDFDTRVSIIARGDGCPFCRGLRILSGFNDLATLNPDAAAQWHPTRNGTTTPSEVGIGSDFAAWWRCRHGHEWRIAVKVRRNHGCPVCANVRIDPDVNSLRVTQPALVAEWHPTMNVRYTPDTIGAGSGRKVWWLCARGHHFDQTVISRVQGSGCRYCRNRACWPGFNDALTQHPRLLQEWDWSANPTFDPGQRLPGNGTHQWVCRAGHRTAQSIPNRRLTRGCPTCAKPDRLLNQPDVAADGNAASDHAI
ncbi:zinc-ribbon domain-containing protein [Curtobacterium luteum]|uniref:zinc-ribbon domain-containing protein n=1 Tax=Curtobacterium luteum TaxID=33881 RepID=UPI0038043454